MPTMISSLSAPSSNEEENEDHSLVSPLTLPELSMPSSSSPNSFFFNDDNYDSDDEEEVDYIDLNLFSHGGELSKEEMQEYVAAPSLDKWRDHSPFDFPTFVTMDEAKTKQWKLAQKEIMHIRKSLQTLMGKDSFKDVTKEDILFLLLGPSTEVARLLKKELALSDEKYLKFLSTMCIQGGYHVSSHELFLPVSLLKDKALMNEAEYNKIWLTFAENRRLSSDTMSTSRREKPIWASLETLVNDILRTIAIAGRDGEISIALDDDKIWLSQANSKVKDLFGLKYTTHTQANRKGIVADTAVTTGITFPSGIVFEKTYDTSVSCFKRLLNSIFAHDDNASRSSGNAFRNLSIHSDRGYMVPSLVFEYLLANGAQVVGTVKRLAGGWPFTFSQNVDENDLRTEIDVKGAPALFLKWCRTKVAGMAGGSRRLFASAFRSGTQRVATAISSMHTHHQWEGVVIDNRELVSYNEDKASLKSKFFKRVDQLFEKSESPEEKEMMEQLLSQKVDAITLRQGK